MTSRSELRRVPLAPLQTRADGYTFRDHPKCPQTPLGVPGSCHNLVHWVQVHEDGTETGYCSECLMHYLRYLAGEGLRLHLEVSQ